ncbi:ATP-binding protein, partial [Actinoallomurus vinaceus]|uniref:ATP-binding protein n=1 Tax=Actinoallomurus vinaceus TaxID=1080074 RepID=UPI003CD06FE2
MGERAMEVASSRSVVPGVRHWIQEVLRDFPQDIRDRVELIASEYTTNCVRHSTVADGKDINLRLTADPDKIRLEVRDQGPARGRPTSGHPRRPPTSAGRVRGHCAGPVGAQDAIAVRATTFGAADGCSPGLGTASPPGGLTAGTRSGLCILTLDRTRKESGNGKGARRAPSMAVEARRSKEMSHSSAEA